MKLKSVFVGVGLSAILPFAAVGAASDRVVEIFTELSRVPRYSGNETRIGDWLMSWAQMQGFNPTRDTAGCGNVIFDVPATKGMEDKCLLVLQVHQDMVRAVKDGVEHDWDADPVIVDVANGWLVPKDHETSLGADDGIGLATVLAIAEGRMAHGPLRVIVTVEEETTQVGVKGLDPKWVKDAKGLINVDWEAEGEVAISSAAQETCTFTRAVATNAVIGKVLREIAVKGLRGGHSGIDIDKGRDNAILDLAKTLAAIGKETEYDLVSFKGGSAKNAIPTFATVVIALPADKADNIASRAAVALESALHAAGETGASVEATDLGSATTAIAAADAAKVLALVTSLPNGVIEMSSVLPGLVQTSSNLGVVDVATNTASVITCLRGSYRAEYDAVLAENDALATANGFTWTHECTSEMWPANPDSRLATLAGEVYRSAFGREISVVATHAGLECGAFAAKNPALDMISVGPTIQNPHTIDECCEVASIDRVWTLLEGLLLKGADPVVPVPVITFFAPDFTQGPTTEVPNVSWKIEGPFDRVSLTIDDTTVYDGDTRCGEGRWRDLCRPGTHRLKLTVGSGDEEVVDSCFYTALLEGDEPAVLPTIGYFYPDYYVGREGTAPQVHWETRNVTSLEFWVDETCVLVSQDAVSEICLSQLKTAGSYVVRLVAHNAIDDAEASFCYRCEASEPPALSSVPLLRSAGSAPVIREFRPDAYEASIWETPYIRWNLSAPADALELKIDGIPVFMGDGSKGGGRWLDVSRLNDGELRTSHDVSLSVSNSLGVVTSNFTYTCHWDEPPPPPLGSEENPWSIGETVQAYTNGLGGLVIVGEGATSNFTGAASLPWAEVVGEITSVAIPDAVATIGDNLWAGLGEDVVINGETIALRKKIASGFPAGAPAGAISPAEFERVDIIDGKAYLAVSVYTSDALTNQNWSVATKVVIEVPAPGKQGFFFLQSKPAGK